MFTWNPLWQVAYTVGYNAVFMQIAFAHVCWIQPWGSSALLMLAWNLARIAHYYVNHFVVDVLAWFRICWISMNVLSPNPRLHTIRKLVSIIGVSAFVTRVNGSSIRKWVIRFVFIWEPKHSNWKQWFVSFAGAVTVCFFSARKEFVQHSTCKELQTVSNHSNWQGRFRVQYLCQCTWDMASDPVDYRQTGWYCQWWFRSCKHP